jgi:hypothetical protein
MRTGLIVKTSVASAALASLAIAAPAAQAMTPTPDRLGSASFGCLRTNCDYVTQYYSDASRTEVVGVFEDGVCGQIAVGVQTQFFSRSPHLC